MPTITAHVPSTTATVVGNTAAADAKVAAVKEKIAALRADDQNGSKIVQDAPQSIPETQAATTLVTPPAEPTKPSADDERLAQLARREKQIRQQAQKLAQREADLTKNQSDRMTKEEFAAQFRKDPTSLGLTYDDLGQIYLNQGNTQDPMIQRLQAEIADLRAGQKQALTQAEQAQTAAYAEALKQIDREAKTLVSKSDAYEVTRSQGAESAITKLIELTYQEEGVLMDVEEAATQVEAYLEQEALSLFSKSNKLKAKLSPGATGTSTQAQMKQTNNTPQKQSVNTLTRSLEQASSKPLTRYERAVLAFQGKLKD